MTTPPRPPVDDPVSYGEDEPFGRSPDAARMTPDGAETDPTGLAESVSILTTAYQVKTAAILSGFSEAEAFQFARDYFTTMMRLSAEATRG